MSKRKFVPIRKLGSTRVDLPLGKKKEYVRRIITLKQPYKVVRKIYLEEFQKDLSYSTFSTWKKNEGKLLIDSKKKSWKSSKTQSTTSRAVAV